ncbi:hypothetical protein KP509_30G054700 [Ceratopteris richardii]|uniref:Uncharacterized protein n=1 Tax=Ceratopteris richardii TaxID=49495 RepID=A0A8T2R4Q9_CERRI|nr:hypothetical protein KP509_30G054700 [Ceratopteris richardii]
MASSLSLACILVLFVALVVAHSAAFAADMEDKGRKLASDSSGTNEKKSSYQAKETEKKNEKKTYSSSKNNNNKEKKRRTKRKAPTRRRRRRRTKRKLTAAAKTTTTKKRRTRRIKRRSTMAVAKVISSMEALITIDVFHKCVSTSSIHAMEKKLVRVHLDSLSSQTLGVHK